MNTTTLPGTVAALHDAPAPVEASADAHEQASPRAGVSELGPELAVAGVLMLLGALVVFDSLRIGMGWADDGPQSGYFPFYIGAMLLASSGFVFVKAAAGWLAARSAAAGQVDPLSARTFVARDELQLVMAMLVPASLYVAHGLRRPVPVVHRVDRLVHAPTRRLRLARQRGGCPGCAGDGVCGV